MDQTAPGRDLSLALGALAIGALGNLPTQDLLQRILSAKSERVAVWSCLFAAVGYLSIGTMPVVLGLAAAALNMTLTDAQSNDVLTVLAQRYLSYPTQVVFLLAVVSAVLSTFASAVMSPAAIVAKNLLEPYWFRTAESRTERQRIRLQRLSVLGIAILSVALSLAGRSAYELLQASYAICLVSLTVPLIGGILGNRDAYAAVASMLVGFAAWAVHFRGQLGIVPASLVDQSLPIPQELGAFASSAVVYLLASSVRTLRALPNDGRGS